MFQIIITKMCVFGFPIMVIFYDLTCWHMFVIICASTIMSDLWPGPFRWPGVLQHPRWAPNDLQRPGCLLQWLCVWWSISWKVLIILLLIERSCLFPISVVGALFLCTEISVIILQIPEILNFFHLTHFCFLLSVLLSIPLLNSQRGLASWQMALGVWMISSTATSTACGQDMTM